MSERRVGVGNRGWMEAERVGDSNRGSVLNGGQIPKCTGQRA